MKNKCCGLQVLSSRKESHSELVHQVFLLMAQKEPGGMEEICDFLRPFMIYSILLIPFSIPSSSLFVKDLVKSMASFTCTFPSKALPIFKLLISCLHYFPWKSVEVSQTICFIGFWNPWTLQHHTKYKIIQTSGD